MMTHEKDGQIYALRSKVFYRKTPSASEVADFDAKMREKACHWAMNRQTPPTPTLTQPTDLAVAYPLTQDVLLNLNPVAAGSGSSTFADG